MKGKHYELAHPKEYGICNECKKRYELNARHSHPHVCPKCLKKKSNLEFERKNMIGR